MLNLLKKLFFLILWLKFSISQNDNIIKLIKGFNLSSDNVKHESDLLQVQNYNTKKVNRYQTPNYGYKNNLNSEFQNDTEHIMVNDKDAVHNTFLLSKIDRNDDKSQWDGEYLEYIETESQFHNNDYNDDRTNKENLQMISDGMYSDEDNSYESICSFPMSVRKIERLNKTKTMDNGKTFIVNKIIKSRKCKKRGTSKNNSIQRRTLTAIPTLTSVLPIPWMTKNSDDNIRIAKGSAEIYSSTRPQQVRIQNDGGNHSMTYSTDKFKKVLNLFTIIKFDNGDCYANGLKGTCFHQIECQAKGGKSIGTCAKGYGICCYVERTCGQITRENCSYFVNEGFPKPTTTAPKICTLMVEKAHPEVEQLRLEFMLFELRGPSNGTCISDRLTITGHNINHIVPDICGINNEQHVYIDVDEANGPYSLNVIMMGNDFPRTFQIKISQLKKTNDLLAPKNCLQYYTETTGVVQTFNYQYGDSGNLPNAVPEYFNNLNYAICLRKNTGFCSVSYQNEERQERSEIPSFQMLNTDADGKRLLPPNQGGAELFDCPDDFIIVNGIRLCGERLNDAAIDPDFTKNYPVTDFSNGPFVLQVRTNNALAGRGFYLRYRQNPCLQ